MNGGRLQIDAEGRQVHPATELRQALTATIELLGRCGLTKQAAWFSERLQTISGECTKESLAAVATEVRSVIAGMGSFTDLPLPPSCRGDLSAREANAMKWQVADALDSATEKIRQSRRTASVYMLKWEIPSVV